MDPLDALSPRKAQPAQLRAGLVGAAHMVSTSAKLAVKRRALRAATWLDLCAGHLLNELEKQTVELYQRHGVLPGGSIDHDLIPITFERRDVEELIRGMRECSAELLQFAK